MNIRRIEETDFRRCDIRVFQDFSNRNKAFIRTLARNDIVVFVSKRRNQMLFIHGFTTFGTGTALQSIRHRIVHGAWSPLMLKDYAIAAGLQIDGLQKFEEHFRRISARRAN